MCIQRMGNFLVSKCFLAPVYSQSVDQIVLEMQINILFEVIWKLMIFVCWVGICILVWGFMYWFIYSVGKSLSVRICHSHQWSSRHFTLLLPALLLDNVVIMNSWLNMCHWLRLVIEKAKVMPVITLHVNLNSTASVCVVILTTPSKL